jgi:putative transposase
VRRKEPINDLGYYHVSTRGSYGRPLFRERFEHELFLQLYARTAEKYRWKTLAWALMWNHHHFLVRLTEGGLSNGMRCLHSNFSRRMNAKDGLTNKGHLVRHCFFAGEALSTESVIRRARYIDLNPVEAGLCARPEQWAWSSYRATLGLSYPQSFHDPAELLRLLSDDPVKARWDYRRFVRQGLDERDIDPWTEQGYESATIAAVVESAA